MRSVPVSSGRLHSLWTVSEMKEWEGLQAMGEHQNDMLACSMYAIVKSISMLTCRVTLHILQ